MAEEQFFKEALKMKRREMSANNRARTQKIKLPIILYPAATEKRYYNEIRKLLFISIEQETRQEINDNYNRWLAEQTVFDSTKVRKDAFTQELRQFINRLRGQNNLKFGEPENPETSEVWQIISGVGLTVNAFSQKQWGKVTKKIFGYEFVSSELWSQDILDAWAQENYTLFKNLTDQEISSINEIISRNVREGKRVEEVKQELSKTYKKFGKSRVSLIARDQVGKLNGKLQEMRQKEVGISYYEWLTVSDERVRGRPGGAYPSAIPSHWEMQGKLCKWSDSSVYADKEDIQPDGSITNWKNRNGKMPIAHPGQEIQCRCSSIPYIDNIINDVDNELKQEL